MSEMGTDDNSRVSSKRPFFSVVMPTFNRKDILLCALRGLSRQTFPSNEFEVVLVSDGSTDGTDEAVAEFSRTAPYTLRYIRQKNGGPSRARNHGIEEAQGEVVVFLDDDVEPEPQFLEAHAAHHRRNERMVVIGPMNRSTDHQNREPVWIIWEHLMLADQYQNFLSGKWPGAGPNHFYSGNASVRRVHLQGIGGFDETFKRQEDVEMAHRLGREYGVIFVFDAKASGHHRPNRTFQSWNNTPYAYGQLDVVRAQRGDVDWELVERSCFRRNLVTRWLGAGLLSMPALERPITRLLLALSQMLHRGSLVLGFPEKVALLPLSVLFNLRYLVGARDAIGGADKLRELTKIPVRTSGNIEKKTEA